MFGFGKKKVVEVPTFLGDAASISAEEKKGKTLYDIQQEAAQSIDSSADYQASNENETDSFNDKHGGEDIQERFDQETVEEQKRAYNEGEFLGRGVSRGTGFSDSHGKHGRKPEKPKGGEKMGAVNDDTKDREDEILNSIDNMAA